MVNQVSSADDFKARIKTPGKVVFVDIFATWCGPCKVIAPVFEKLSSEFPDCVFIKVNADEVEAVTEEYDVQALPTFLVFKEGALLDRMTGSNSEKLKQLIKTHAEA
ncbi:thioredoxin-1 [Galendromus occidentalis]|uniref:Thioredoxin n=1 Tax=Galendromus occidentalis TaxID=34638 RepID=A0AAJ6VW38_9ACAR|nr:thioredoxin-1 [Galendromus occidentalis]